MQLLLSVIAFYISRPHKQTHTAWCCQKEREEEEVPIKLVQGLPAPPALCCYLSQSVGCKNSTGSVTLEHGSVFLTPLVPWWQRQRRGVVEWDPSACDREPTQLEEYSWRGDGESGGQLDMEAEGQK